MAEVMSEWKVAELALQQATRPAVTLIAFGAGGLLFGSLIAALSEGGRTPGLVIVCLAAPGFFAGLFWGRRLARLHRFRVLYRSSVPLMLLIMTAGVIAVAVSLAIGAFLGIAGGVLIAFLLPLIVRLYVGLRTALLISFAGVQIAYQRVPWAAVQHILVADTGDSDDVTIGVRLREGAREEGDGMHRRTRCARRITGLVCGLGLVAPAVITSGTPAQAYSPDPDVWTHHRSARAHAIT